MTSNPDNYDTPPLEEAMARGRELREYRKTILMPQHIAFVNAYFNNKFDLALSAEAVGISRDTARKWVEQDGPVQTYLAKRLEQYAQASDISLDEIVGLLIKEATREPSGPGDKSVNHMARVASLDTLAKIKGAYVKEKPVERKITVNINVGSPKDAQMVTVEGSVDE